MIIRKKISVLAGVVLSFASLVSCVEQKNHTRNVDQQFADKNLEMEAENIDTATLGTGCFWCTEAIFQRLKGVVKVISGYSGGNTPNPTYEEVCSGTTGYAEACQVIFDPKVISYDDLLKVFWQVHDPTTLNRQGNDVGTQYRSVIFFHNAVQEQKAMDYKAELQKSGAWDKPIITAIEAYKNFYPAEKYHQNYYNSNPRQMYCQYVIKPKLEKFEKVFKDKLK